MNKTELKIRRAAQRGKEITIPARATLQVGDKVTAYYSDDFVLFVPAGAKVDESLLLKGLGRNDGGEGNPA